MFSNEYSIYSSDRKLHKDDVLIGNSDFVSFTSIQPVMFHCSIFTSTMEVTVYRKIFATKIFCELLTFHKNFFRKNFKDTVKEA